MKRSEAREQAFLLIFERNFRSESMEEIIEAAVEARELSPDPFAEMLAKGTYEYELELDGVFEKHLIKWKKERVSRVAISLLRLATYEIYHVDDVPVSVSINEAVELAKKYAGEDDAAFVNGVLGAVAREREAGQE